MTSLTTTVAPSSPPVHISPGLRPHPSQLILGLTLGVLAELLLDGRAFGLGHALFAVALGSAIAIHGGKEGWQRAGEHRWVLLGAVLLLASTMLHASVWLAVLSTLSSIGLFSLALLGWSGERPLASLRTGALVSAPFRAFGKSAHSGVVTAQRGLAGARIGPTLASLAPAALRLLVIVCPPVLVLVFLLSSGDAVFRARVGALETALFGIPLEGFMRGSFVIAVAATLCTGAIAFSNRRREGVALTAPPRVLSPLESLALLGSLTSVLLAFGITSTPCAMAPAACALPEGVTYAEAAHEGFFELLFAAMGILGLLMALPARTKLDDAKTRLGFTVLSTALVLGTMPMIISAVARLWRYESIYGLTVLRLLAYAGLALVSAVLAWRALTLWTMQHAFVSGALVLFTSTLLGLAVMRPDEVIARRNVTMQVPDFDYLLTLSDDALPTLIATGAFDELGTVRTVRSDSALEWNLGRSRARQALQAR